jgi:hypothetical protein
MSGSISLAIGIVFVLAFSIWMISKTSKSLGKSEEKEKSLREGEERRRAFDDEVSRPIHRGSDLIDKLRERVGR